MRLLHCVFLGLAVSCSATAQTYTISTYAGGGLPVNIPGASADLGGVSGVAVDGAGNVFFGRLYTVLRLDAITGILSLAAGNGTQGFSGDNGPAPSAQLRFTTGLAVDSAGNLYIADTGNNRIRKVDTTGIITTIAGTGTAGANGDGGPATAAELNRPIDLAIADDNSIYFTDEYNNCVRKIDPAGVITTCAGSNVGFP